MRRKQNGDFNVWNSRRFLFGMRYVYIYVPTVKSAILLVTLNFELVKMDIVNRHSQSNFAHSFDFHCLTNVAKGIDLLFFFCTRFLFGVLLRNIQFIPRKVIDI